VGGSFHTINGQSNNYLRAVDLTNDALLSWNPVIDGSIECMTNSGQELFVSGFFNTVDGQTRRRLASFNCATGSLTPWTASLTVSSLAGCMENGEGYVYLGGDFETINTQVHHFLAGLSIDFTAGIKEIFIPKNEVLIFPQPARNSCTIFTNDGQSILEVSLFNRMGQLVKSIHVDSSENRFEIQKGNLPAGIYFITLDLQDHNRITTRILFE
ncbi:MAG TPA: T9SS type A sorting domain-containing protein, partial [Bacteroidia bacterium]|nr:T9SS type A sorting domain-containing protein [Bacteroidia bacterium]